MSSQHDKRRKRKKVKHRKHAKSHRQALFAREAQTAKAFWDFFLQSQGLLP